MCYLARSRDDRRTAGEGAMVLACERLVYFFLLADGGVGGTHLGTLFISSGERTTVAFLPLEVTLGDWATMGMAFLLLVILCKGDGGVASTDEALLVSEGISSASLLLVALGNRVRADLALLRVNLGGKGDATDLAPCDAALDSGGEEGTSLVFLSLE